MTGMHRMQPLGVRDTTAAIAKKAEVAIPYRSGPGSGAAFDSTMQITADEFSVSKLRSVTMPYEVQNRPKRGTSFRSPFRFECPARRVAPERGGLVDVPPTGINCTHQCLRPSLRVLLRSEAQGVAAY